MSVKAFKTIDEQLDLLESRGLDIPDRQKAYDFLYRNNYYRVSGYSLTLRSHDVFSSSASFQNIIDIYEFDHEMRHILMKYIERIEVVFKSVYAHEFTKVHAPDDYLDSQYFTDSKKHSEIIKKAEEQKEKRHKHEAYLKHFIDDLQQNLTLWAYVDLLTISDISFIFKISEPSIKTAIAQSLNLKISKGVELLEHFMHLMTLPPYQTCLKSLFLFGLHRGAGAFTPFISMPMGSGFTPHSGVCPIWTPLLLCNVSVHFT